VDVSSWAYRDDITKISVSYAAVGSTTPWSMQFQIDDVGWSWTCWRHCAKCALGPAGADPKTQSARSWVFWTISANLVSRSYRYTMIT
jgi:hypothetical protein